MAVATVNQTETKQGLFNKSNEELHTLATNVGGYGRPTSLSRDRDGILLQRIITPLIRKDDTPMPAVNRKGYAGVLVVKPTPKITNALLFDAFYGERRSFIDWAVLDPEKATVLNQVNLQLYARLMSHSVWMHEYNFMELNEGGRILAGKYTTGYGSEKQGEFFTYQKEVLGEAMTHAEHELFNNGAILLSVTASSINFFPSDIKEIQRSTAALFKKIYKRLTDNPHFIELTMPLYL